MSDEQTAKFTITNGDRVWVPVAEEECYRSVRVREKQSDTVSVFDDNYKQMTVKVDQVFPLNPKNFDGVPDNTQMMWLNDPSLLHNIRYRYEKNQIYTYTAYILIAVNPYKRITGLYEDDMIWKYYNANFGVLDPHAYGIASRAYRMMKSSMKNQSIVVSGESGAGKTETCKFLMRFFALVAGASSTDSTLQNIETKVLQANPVMEAFGNAKTIRNNNSSRFGKFTELHFNKEAHLVGASIVTYLLEKSRVVGQSKNERNFHVFYQLLAGASDDEKSKYKLLPVEQYTYLNQSGCTTVDGVDDAREFTVLKDCMNLLNMDQENIFCVLSGILHLGNVRFVETVNAEKEDVTIVDPATNEALTNAAELLGFDKDSLAEKLVFRTIIVGNKNTAFDEPLKKKGTFSRLELKSDPNTNVYKIPLTAQEAVYSRDSLAKFIYNALFDSIVKKINQSLPFKDSAVFIGILDISGFEIFPNNSFEQFSINFANEKIQQYFNQQILKQEQEIYLLEGLQWRKIEYQDNQDVIHLVEARRVGIFALLDEACIVPKGTDRSFTGKVHTTHSANPVLDAPKYGKEHKTARLNKDEGFVVHHFAGQVVYNTQNFLDKNNDTLHDDLSRMLYVSKRRFVVELFPPPEDDLKAVTVNRRFKSVSARFQQQLDQLMTVLNTTTSHFIRCIKPNESQKPDLFNASSVMQQLRYNGMCTALKLMQYGFPTRFAFEDLYERYSKLMPPIISNLPPNRFCEALLVALDLDGGKDFQMGLTKVFFRAGKLQFLDELTSSSQEILSNIASKVKRWLARKRWHSSVYATLCAQILKDNLERIRKLHQIRHLARQFTVMSKVWFPLINKARQNIMTSEEYKKKLEEEERRKEEERERERKKREEEERIRRQKEEEQLRIQEQAKRELEEARRREEDARRHAEEKIKNQTTKINVLEENLALEVQKSTHLQTSIENVKSDLDNLKIQLEKLEISRENLDQKLAVETQAKRAVEQMLHESQSNIETHKSEISELKNQLEVQNRNAVALRQLLEDERDSHKKEVTAILATANSSKSELQTQLEHVISEKSQVENMLSQQQLLNKQLSAENDSLKKQLEQLQAAFNKHVEDSKNAMTAEIKRYDDYHVHMTQEVSARDSIIQTELNEKKKLKEEIQHLNDNVETETNNVANLTRQKAAVEAQYADEQAKVKSLEADLHQEKDINDTARKEIASLQSLNESLNNMLTQEKETNQNLTQQLADEKKAREADNLEYQQKIEKLFNQAKLDIKAKQVIIKKLETTNEELTTKLHEETERSKKRISELEEQLSTTSKKLATLEDEHKLLKARYDSLSEKHKQLEAEKTKLTTTALSLQETKRKFKTIMDRSAKQEEVAKLIFGELTFAHVIKDCTKHGLLQKQGGQHVNRWQARHVIINENYLFYYGSPSDKQPKGLARIDGDHLQEVARCNLSNLKKEHAFTLTIREKDKTRAFFFSATSEEDCSDWIKVIQQAQQMNTYI